MTTASPGNANPLASDFNHILERTGGLWEEMRGQRVFVAGGTGFFGHWLLESLLAANDRLHLGISALVLSRNPDAFCREAPHLAAHSCVRMVEGDVRGFAFPDGEFAYVIHAATEASVKKEREAPLEIFDTIVEGTRRMLEFARLRHTKKFLLTSSGAVYGKQPRGVTRLTEDYSGGPDPSDWKCVYAEAKRSAELLCSIYSEKYALECKIARCFAFVGPHLPLDAHFAIGNFIRDAMAGGPIRVLGDGTPFRSYLYASDLAIWLWTILIRGKSRRPYNVGSERAVSIAETAAAVAEAGGDGSQVELASSLFDPSSCTSYVPDTRRARTELHLEESVDLATAIQKTIAWHAFRMAGENRT